ncbi:hypothetical protein X975_11687, partial [Stegodyphus mimosarum]
MVLQRRRNNNPSNDMRGSTSEQPEIYQADVCRLFTDKAETRSVFQFETLCFPEEIDKFERLLCPF